MIAIIRDVYNRGSGKRLNCISFPSLWFLVTEQNANNKTQGKKHMLTLVKISHSNQEKQKTND